MTRRDVRRMTPDDLFEEWVRDIQEIKFDIFELFSFRRTFREFAEVFRQNERLQAVGGHVWNWMRSNYVASILLRVRRQVDDQSNTVNLKQLLTELMQRPEVLTRRRLDEALPKIDSDVIREQVDARFTELWVRVQHPDPGDDHVSAEVIVGDLQLLQDATRRVAKVANRNVAHRSRVSLQDLQVPELDAAFDAIEATLKRCYALLAGGGLVRAEPAPQFNTLEVFTFPWISET